MCIQNLVGHSVKLLYRGVPFVGDLITIDVEANTMLINCHQLSGSLYQIQHFNYSIKQLNSFVQLPINGIEWIAKCSNISDEAIFFPQEMGYTNFVINCFNCAKPVTFVPCQPEDEAKFIIIGGNKLDFIHDKQLKDPLDSFPINCNMCMSDGILPPTVSNSPSHLILSDLEKYGPRKILQNLSAYPPFNVEFHVDAFVDECSSASALDNTFPSGEPYESPSSTEDIPVAEEHLNVKRVSVGKLPSTTFRDVKEKGQINPKKSQKKVTWRPFISTSIPEAKASPPQQKTMSYGNMPSSSLGAYPKTAPKQQTMSYGNMPSSSLGAYPKTAPKQQTMSYGNMPSSSLGAYPKTAPKQQTMSYGNMPSSSLGAYPKTAPKQQTMSYGNMPSSSLGAYPKTAPKQQTMSYGNMPSSSLGAYPKTAPKKPLDKMRKKKKHSRVFRKNASNE